MSTPSSPQPQAHSRPRPRPRQRLTLGEAMLLVAGLGVALWLVLPSLRKLPQSTDTLTDSLVIITFLLGGLSLVGPPLLLWERRRSRRPWGAGKLLWFSQGMAPWLLWPPLVYSRARGRDLEGSTTAVCFAFGTPLMAIYVASALLAGGRLRRRGRRALRRSWREAFGLLLALAWACTGLYVLYLLYRSELER